MEGREERISTVTNEVGTFQGDDITIAIIHVENDVLIQDPFCPNCIHNTIVVVIDKAIYIAYISVIQRTKESVTDKKNPFTVINKNLKHQCGITFFAAT